MIYKSYLIEKNISIIKQSATLFYGENLGLKNDFKKIYGKHSDAISSFSLDHLLKHSIKKKHIEIGRAHV